MVGRLGKHSATEHTRVLRDRRASLHLHRDTVTKLWLGHAVELVLQQKHGKWQPASAQVKASEATAAQYTTHFGTREQFGTEHTCGGVKGTGLVRLAKTKRGSEVKVQKGA